MPCRAILFAWLMLTRWWTSGAGRTVRVEVNFDKIVGYIQENCERKSVQNYFRLMKIGGLCLNIKITNILMFCSNEIFLHDWVASNAGGFLCAFSLRIPCHSVRVISEYVAPNITSGITKRTTSKNRLKVLSNSLVSSGQYSRHLRWPENICKGLL